MKIYSDILTMAQIREDKPMSMWIDESREFRPQKINPDTGQPYRFGCELYAEGMFSRRRNGREGYAATYDQYGEWFSLLFERDPHAWISGWNGCDEFHTRTGNLYRMGA